MSRRSNAAVAADRAAQEAAQAARILQARGQEKKDSVDEGKEPFQTNEHLNKVPRGNIHRDQMMEEIRQSRGEPKEEKEKKNEPAADKPVVEKEPEKKAEDTGKEVAKPEPSITEPEVPAETVDEPVQKKVKVKVDGVEDEVDESVVNEYGGVKGYQIAKALENRLAKTKEVSEENRKTQAQLSDIAKLLIQQAPKKEEQTDDQFIASKVDTIRFGTPEESAAALKEILSKTQQRIDPNQIIEQATQRMIHDQAVKEFDRDHQDIVTNPLLLKLAVALRNEGVENAKKSGQRIEWSSFYKGIGNQIRSALPRQNQPKEGDAKAKDNPSQTPDKEARKASISEPPKAAAARAAPQKEEKEETREDSIRSMRKARGLPVD